MVSTGGSCEVEGVNQIIRCMSIHNAALLAPRLRRLHSVLRLDNGLLVRVRVSISRLACSVCLNIGIAMRVPLFAVCRSLGRQYGMRQCICWCVCWRRRLARGCLPLASLLICGHDVVRVPASCCFATAMPARVQWLLIESCKPLSWSPSSVQEIWQAGIWEATVLGAMRPDWSETKCPEANPLLKVQPTFPLFWQQIKVNCSVLRAVPKLVAFQHQQPP